MNLAERTLFWVIAAATLSTICTLSAWDAVLRIAQKGNR